MPMTEGTVRSAGTSPATRWWARTRRPAGKRPSSSSAEGRAGAEWVVFEDSAHLAKVEEPDRYREALDVPQPDGRR